MIFLLSNLKLHLITHLRPRKDEFFLNETYHPVALDKETVNGTTTPHPFKYDDWLNGRYERHHLKNDRTFYP